MLQNPRFIIKNGKPDAVILPIKEYQKVLERMEEREDVAELKKIKRSKTHFRALEEYLGRNDL